MPRPDPDTIPILELLGQRVEVRSDDGWMPGHIIAVTTDRVAYDVWMGNDMCRVSSDKLRLPHANT